MSEKEMVPVEAKVKEATAKDFFEQMNQVPVEKVNLIGIGVAYIHGFTEVEKTQWLDYHIKEDGTVNRGDANPAMMVLCLRDRDGKRLFTEKDMLKLKTLSSRLTRKITDVCCRLSGIGAPADEDILANFDETVTDAS